MAQTKKRKRKGKHRGNAAGMVEVRGRTGRKLSAEERLKSGMQVSRAEVRQERSRQPPTWKGATVRGFVAAAILVLIMATLMGRSLPQALVLGAFVVVFYVPIGFYTDTFLYDRRVRKEKELLRR